MTERTVIDSTRLEVLDRRECLALLAATPVGRIIFTHRALPAVEPVNFVLDGDTIVIRTGPGAKLTAAGKNAVVAFEIDEIDINEHTGWSVTVVGRSEEVRDEAERSRLARLPLRPWAPGEHDHFIRIRIEVVTGRRIPDGRRPTSAWQRTVPIGTARE
jgi:nitroimidazol reductase NimA-like FMN-containing flavoprotein (pyridoxamine 5'-phosphate oxidase superfamily)